MIILDPCEIGYEYRRGNVIGEILAPFKEKDNAQCAFECTNNYECKSYEFYDRKCNLFNTSDVSTSKSSGFFNCKRIGNSQMFNEHLINSVSI